AADATASGQEAHYDVDRIEATGIDVAAVAALLDQGPEALTDQTFYQPVEAVAWDGMQLATGPLAATVRHAEARGVKLRRLVAGLANGGAMTPERAAEVLSAIAVEKLEYDGLDARVAGKDAVHLTLARVALADMAAGHLGSFAL